MTSDLPTPTLPAKLTTEKGRALNLSAQQNDLTTIKEMVLEQSVPMDERGMAGVTVLMQAASQGKIPMLHFALSQEADWSLTDDSGSNAVHRAAMNDRDEALGILLDAGANIFSQAAGGKTGYELAILYQSSAAGKVIQCYQGMPPLPKNLSELTHDGLFEMAPQGYRLLDNPEFWHGLNAVTTALEANGEAPLTKEDLSHTNINGVSGMQRAVECRCFVALSNYLKRQGDPITPHDMMDSNQTFQPWARSLITTGQAGELFRPSIWLDQSEEDLKQAINQIPLNERWQVSNEHSLTHAVQMHQSHHPDKRWRA